ncbi:MAG: glucans biosynthesis glucosyltransferase MdoH [Hyphomicrobiaceae bacterium]
MTTQISRNETDAREASVSARLAMPPQPLYGKGAERQQLRDSGPDAAGRVYAARIFLIALTCALTALFAWGLTRALAIHSEGGTILHFAFLSVSTLGFSWMAFGTANTALGAIILMLDGQTDTVPLASPTTELTERTALLFPIYHEDPEDIAANVAALVDDLDSQDLLTHFSIFVLSDSQSEASRHSERSVFDVLSDNLAPRISVTYRNRDKNIGKKAGNIADWVTRWGHDFTHFVVFDADSRMSAETLRCLVATMQQRPDTALIQTVPRLIGSSTVFGRLQEFASALSGRLAAAGYAAWQGGSGNYWGHNAIIRTRAFAECAGLPVLPGQAPFGGHIQSHDFVEAALLRRAGWRVALVTSLHGSYEGTPQSLVDMAVRDRRWMQGNLQHGVILPADGIRPISRIHLAMGILSYLSSALWAAMIGLGLLLVWQEQERTIAYFADQKTLFPVWPIFDPQAGLRLLVGTLVVVFLPKIIGLSMALFAAVRRGHSLGVLWRIHIGWWIEVVYSALLAPVAMLLHMKSLAEILVGRDSGWRAQNRGATGIRFSEAMRFHAFHVSVGVALAIVAASLSWYAFLWLSPILLGLVLSPVLTAATSPTSASLSDVLRTDAFAPVDQPAPASREDGDHTSAGRS